MPPDWQQAIIGTKPMMFRLSQHIYASLGLNKLTLFYTSLLLSLMIPMKISTTVNGEFLYEW